jgi:aminobenzoyl-glutamate transport protein
MTGEAFSETAPQGGGFMERALAWVEKAGNRVLDPAILFIGLIVFVIVLSQVLDWANVGTTSQVAEPPPAQVESTENSYDPPEQVNGADYEIKTERVEAKGLLTADGIHSCSPRSCRTSSASRRWA